MRLTPGLGVHLRGLADRCWSTTYPGATISAHEREMLATAVSAANDCFFCMDSHGAHATALLERDGDDGAVPLLDTIKIGSSEGSTPRCRRCCTSRGRSAATPRDADRGGHRGGARRRRDRCATSSWRC